MATVLALHGQSLNGAYMRRELAYIEELGVELVCPDAPNPSAADLVDRLYAIWDSPRQPPPHCSWWDATDDGRIYRGWEATRDLLAPILQRGPVGIIGFSQGAILATALAALAEHGQAPPVEYVILIAGRSPRADVFAPYLREPLRTRSLHVWGETDTLVGDTSRELVDRFDLTTRRVVTWPGGHYIPARGPAAEAIARMIRDR
ncbi:MAG: hypothetical protein JNL83_26680 [Myxococcales bacterium]|nr:hypothetical protein [Myxococcales bacterium]